MKINCIIVEDEPLSMDRAKSYIQQIPFLHLQAGFENGMDALEFLRLHKTDLLFLDIHLGEISGIQLLETALPGSQVVLITAYPEYALKGFDLQVADYLLKPYTFGRFLQAAKRVQSNLAVNNQEIEQPFVFIKTGDRLEKIILNEILFIEGVRDYRRIHTITKKILTLKTFTELEQEISAAVICRVHKSYMVALNKVDSVSKEQVIIRDTPIPVSETYRKFFFDQLLHVKR